MTFSICNHAAYVWIFIRGDQNSLFHFVIDPTVVFLFFISNIKKILI